MPYKRTDSRYWWATYTDARGRKVRRSTQSTSWREAREIEARWRAEARRERLTGEQPDRTFDQLFLSYLTETESTRHHERDIYAARHLQAHFTGLILSEIGSAEVGAYKRARADQGASSGTILKELGLLSRAINYARREWGWRVENPVTGRLPAPPPGRVRWLTKDEYRRLRGAAKAHKRAPWMGPFIELAVNTGMRKGELLELEWSRVDLERGEIYLAPEHQKGKKYSVVPLNAGAVAALKALHRKGNRWVFMYAGERIKDVKSSWASIRKDAGLSDVRIHDLRHTCAAWLVQAGVPLREVAEVLRHGSIQTTMKYAHLAADSARRAVDSLND